MNIYTPKHALLPFPTVLRNLRTHLENCGIPSNTIGRMKTVAGNLHQFLRLSFFLSHQCVDVCEQNPRYNRYYKIEVFFWQENAHKLMVQAKKHEDKENDVYSVKLSKFLDTCEIAKSVDYGTWEVDENDLENLILWMENNIHLALF